MWSVEQLVRKRADFVAVEIELLEFRQRCEQLCGEGGSDAWNFVFRYIMLCRRKKMTIELMKPFSSRSRTLRVVLPLSCCAISATPLDLMLLPRRQRRLSVACWLTPGCHQDKTGNEQENGQFVKFSDTE